MITNDKGQDIIRRFERDPKSPEASPKPALKAYLCPAKVLTIGWGHTRDPYTGRPDVKPGTVITEHQADELLAFDLSVLYEPTVRRVCPTANANQHSAFVALCFNIGVHAFTESTAVKRHNEGDFAQFDRDGKLVGGAAEAILWFNKGRVDGKLVDLPGLSRRRAAECALYLEPIN